jgi:ubiquitin C-terminal hydrolase
MSGDLTRVQIISYSQSEFKIRATWTATVLAADAPPITSPAITFQRFSVYLVLSLTGRRFTIIFMTTSLPEERFSCWLSVTLLGSSPCVHASSGLHFSHKQHRGFLIFGIPPADVIPLIRDSRLPLEITIVHRTSVVVRTDNLGYSGLANQGATCYLNSLLQALFHLPAFRSIVFQIAIAPTEKRIDSIPYNLQKLFYDMQFRSKVCSTRPLTISFGWTAGESFVQRDIQELCRIFITNLEEKLKGTRLADSISSLFKGQLEKTIRCVNVNYRTSTFEEFYDLSLDVEHCTSLEDSIARFTAPQQLVGENEYDTDHGKQPAILETRFVKVPPVLYLHLRRFRYDPTKGRLMKVNDRFTFPNEFCLSGANFYELFGVLVHSGTAEFGHYYAYLRPTPSPSWFEFNDSTVTSVQPSNAIDKNFGDGSSPSSAYMLIYFLRASISTLFATPIAPQLTFTDAREEEEDGNEGFQVRIVTNDDLLKECSELSIKTSRNSGILCLPRYDASPNDYIDRTAAFFDLDRSLLNVWTFDDGFRGCQLILPKRSRFDKNFRTSAVFVRIGFPPIKSQEILVFLKFFAGTLNYIGSRVISHSAPVSTIIPEICAILGFPEDTQLFAYCQRAQTSFDRLQPEETFSRQAVLNGAALVFESDPSFPSLETAFPFGITTTAATPIPAAGDLEVVRLERSLDRPGFEAYIERKYCMNLTTISRYEDPKTPLFVLQYSANTEVSLIVRTIAEHLRLDYDPERDAMCLYDKATLSDEPGSIPVTRTRLHRPHLFFRLFPGTPQAVLETLTEVKVRIEKTPERSVMIQKSATVSELYAACSLDPDSFMAYNLGFTMSPNILLPTTRISEVYALLVYFQRKHELTDDQKSVPVTRPSRPDFFVPFFFVANKGESFTDAKARLRAELNIDEITFNALEIFIQTRPAASGPIQRVYPNDSSDLFELIGAHSQIHIQQPLAKLSTSPLSLMIRN